jgi:MerR family redox-sensitive transcriptional activator SoxR
MAIQHGISIGYVAERTGLAVSAIRFYEEKGLVQSERNAGGQRRFQRGDIRRLSFVQIAQQLDEKIAALTVLRDRLDGCIGCGCLSLPNCALYNPQDRAAQKGAGPRFLMGDSPNDPFNV